MLPGNESVRLLAGALYPNGSLYKRHPDNRDPITAYSNHQQRVVALFTSYGSTAIIDCMGADNSQSTILSYRTASFGSRG